jgi:hypothetical protein
MKRIAVASSMILLSACANNVANNSAWVKPGATQTELGQDREGCMQQSQQRDALMAKNNAGFNACMNALGYVQDKRQDDGFGSWFNDMLSSVPEIPDFTKADNAKPATN